MEQLDQLTSNVTTLIARYEQLKAENAMLREANQSQRAEILRSHADLEELEKQYSRLRLASAVTDTTATECESFYWRGDTYTASGVYYDSLTNIAGCEAISYGRKTKHPSSTRRPSAVAHY